MLHRVKKNDLVVVTSGKDRGKQGHVINVDYMQDKVIVKGVGIVTRHVKARKQGETSRIVKEEQYLNLSSVMPICPSCKKSCRVQAKFLSGQEKKNKKARMCHRCKEAF